MQDECEALGLSGCSSLEGARFGVDFGLGFGAVFGLAPSARLRADLLWQYYVVNLYTVEYTDATVSRNLGGSRFFLMAGAEFP